MENIYIFKSTMKIIFFMIIQLAEELNDNNIHKFIEKFQRKKL